MSEDDATVRYAKEQVRRMNKARDFPEGTCPSSRHVAMMAEHLSRSGKYHMLTDEPRHCAGSLASTVASLWEARAKLKELGYCNEGSGWVATALAEAEAEIARLRDALAPCAAILAQQGLPEGREYLIGGAFRVTVSEALDKANAALA